MFIDLLILTLLIVLLFSDKLLNVACLAYKAANNNTRILTFSLDSDSAKWI